MLALRFTPRIEAQLRTNHGTRSWYTHECSCMLSTHSERFMRMTETQCVMDVDRSVPR